MKTIIASVSLLALLMTTPVAAEEEDQEPASTTEEEEEIILNYKASIEKVTIECGEDDHCEEHNGRKLWCGYS